MGDVGIINSRSSAIQVFCNIDSPCYFFRQNKRQGNSYADRYDPPQTARAQRQIGKYLSCHFQMSKLMKNVNEGTDSCRSDSQTHANTGKADEFIDNDQEHDCNRHGIYKQQERQRNLDNLVQTQIGCGKAEQRNNRNIRLIGQPREFAGKKF